MTGSGMLRCSVENLGRLPEMLVPKYNLKDI